jgi:superfamily II DNA/RNA helicase
MPKNKKPAGGRPAKNFEPRFGAKTSFQDRKRRPGESSAGSTGSKSPTHRGYREETAESAPKRRWTSAERAGRDEARGIREGRPARSFDERPARREGDRPARSFDDRPRRSFDDRPARSFDDRPRRSFDERPARREGDRPARSFDDRPRRSFDDRPARSFDDRPARREGDRPARSFDERPRRSFDDRPARREGDRPARSFGDRPARSFDDRPRRSFDDRPARSFDDRPRRSSDDRPARREGGNRSDWNATAAKAHEQHVDVVHERLEAEAVQAETIEGQGFGELGLGQNIVKVLAELGAPSPFPIQSATIPPILEGRDVLARGRTGSGKTIAFGAPLVERILRSQAGSRREFGRRPKALILAPTRELALQIDRTVQPIARSVGLFTTQIYGGVPQARQVGALKKGIDIIIGTPGRIEDLINQGKLDLSEVQVSVLDEADHMAELGFAEPVQRILRLTGEGSQKLLFSATLDREVAALVDEFLVDPAVYEVAGETQETGTIDHRVFVVDHRDKAELLASLVDRDGKTLVFSRTRAFAEMLVENFEDAGISAVALHGDLNQAKRTRNLQRLTDGKVNVLVATDVAARGIHVDDIDLVIQADAPDEYKTYLHRSGRTGRAGRSGTVVTLVPRQRRRRMTELLSRAEIDAPFEEVRPGDDVVEEVAGRQLADVASA